MSLTTGRAPLSANPAGRFEPPIPAGALYVEPLLRRVRAVVGARVVIDSERVVLVHRAGSPPTYAFPESDVWGVPARVEPAAAGYVRVAWGAVTAWYEEEEQVFGGHPKNPYHRIDCVRTRRRLRVELASTVLVDTTDVIALYETSRIPQLYVRRESIRMDLLVASPTMSYCPYKGKASYWTAEVDGVRAPDVAWSYDNPTPESTPIAGLLSFYHERAKMVQDVLTYFVAPPPACAPAEQSSRPAARARGPHGTDHDR
jgi:uncharacterized protein (DUF427 family)